MMMTMMMLPFDDLLLDKLIINLLLACLTKWLCKLATNKSIKIHAINQSAPWKSTPASQVVVSAPSSQHRSINHAELQQNGTKSRVSLYFYGELCHWDMLVNSSCAGDVCRYSSGVDG